MFLKLLEFFPCAQADKIQGEKLEELKRNQEYAQQLLGNVDNPGVEGGAYVAAKKRLEALKATIKEELEKKDVPENEQSEKDEGGNGASDADEHQLNAQPLKEWFLRNFAYPFPSEDEKDHLCRISGYKRNQLADYFVNQRGRYAPGVFFCPF